MKDWEAPAAFVYPFPVRWRIDPTKAAQIWQVVAPSTGALKERLVRPQARSYVRDVLNYAPRTLKPDMWP